MLFDNLEKRDELGWEGGSKAGIYMYILLADSHSETAETNRRL